ncbi:MAG: hypothetical protein P1U65_14725 [Minwuia sp.]|nr:hypothetical protein [Minwuia sp.]
MMTGVLVPAIRGGLVGAVALTVGLWSVAGLAQDNRGEVFGDHTVAENTRSGGGRAASDDGKDKLLDDLRTLVDEAEKARAADPRFIRDLRSLMERHDQPKFELLVKDTFEDGDFTRVPKWQVTQGEFRIGRYGGLVSEVVAARASVPQNNDNNGRGNSDAEAVVRLFGQILGAQTGNQDQQGTAAAQTEEKPEPALIYLVQPMSNAFDVLARLESDPEAGGTLELGVFQGQKGRSGYRIVFGSRGEAQLIRVGRDVKVLARAAFRMPGLVDGWRNPGYVVAWRRDQRGRMLVVVDDKTLFDVTDTAFRDTFDGLRLRNVRGRHALQAVEVYGHK